MSDTKHSNGGSAFPEIFTDQPAAKGTTRYFNVYSAGGMSLRDYFAGQALASMVAGEGARHVANRDGRYDETNWREVVAANAYEFADAMLAERAK